MISGLPPFRAATEYLIFKKVSKAQFCFPDGFDPLARDLVEKLIVVDPRKRLGSNDECFYKSIRRHAFFDSIDWCNIKKQDPPKIYPYLPGVTRDDDFTSHYFVPDHLEPGLGERQITRLLGLELGTYEEQTEAKSSTTKGPKSSKFYKFKYL